MTFRPKASACVLATNAVPRTLPARITNLLKTPGVIGVGITVFLPGSGNGPSAVGGIEPCLWLRDADGKTIQQRPAQCNDTQTAALAQASKLPSSAVGIAAEGVMALTDGQTDAWIHTLWTLNGVTARAAHGDRHLEPWHNAVKSGGTDQKEDAQTAADEVFWTALCTLLHPPAASAHESLANHQHLNSLLDAHLAVAAQNMPDLLGFSWHWRACGQLCP